MGLCFAGADMPTLEAVGVWEQTHFEGLVVSGVVALKIAAKVENLNKKYRSATRCSFGALLFNV